MQSSDQILTYTFLAVMLVSLAAVFSRSASGFSATLGNGKFKYKYDKSKTPDCVRGLILLAGVSLVFGAIVDGNFGNALIFMLAVTFFGGIAIFLRVGYVPKK